MSKLRKKRAPKSKAKPSPLRNAKGGALDLHPADGPYEVHTTSDSELVFGLVGPLGTDNEAIVRLLEERLRSFSYDTKTIKISSVIIPALAYPREVPCIPKYKRAKTLIDLGDQIRKDSRNNAVLAIAAATEVARLRPNPKGKVQRTAYVVSSLKHPEEVAELRKIYGNGFYLFAVHTDRERRVQHLSGDAKEMTRAQAWELIDRDEHEPEEYGQHTRDTFHLADFFLADENNQDKLRHSVNRCIDLVFGNPTITPTFNEFAMFMAFASSLRSGDLSRQVGAVVAKGNEILSTGANDCPAAGGGLYWPTFIGDRIDDVPRGRDYKRGCDSNVVEKEKLVREVTERLPQEWRQQVEAALRSSRLNDLTEYGRVVHAEMEALLACARSTASCAGATLFCTTFPCHNCAKHIVAAGIEQVIYVEPYPKSKAIEFHDDSITTEKLEGSEKKVRFKPFIGVGPRQFFDLFSVSMSCGRPMVRKKRDGQAADWEMSAAMPRVAMLPVAHRDFEALAKVYLGRLKREPGGKA